MLPDGVDASLRLEARRRGVPMAVVAREILERELAPPSGANRLSFVGLVDDPSVPDDLSEHFDRHLGESLGRDYDRARAGGDAAPRR